MFFHENKRALSRRCGPRHSSFQGYLLTENMKYGTTILNWEEHVKGAEHFSPIGMLLAERSERGCGIGLGFMGPEKVGGARMHAFEVIPCEPESFDSAWPIGMAISPDEGRLLSRERFLLTLNKY
jgi:hypothetical protein